MCACVCVYMCGRGGGGGGAVNCKWDKCINIMEYYEKKHKDKGIRNFPGQPMKLFLIPVGDPVRTISGQPRLFIMQEAATPALYTHKHRVIN